MDLVVVAFVLCFVVPGATVASRGTRRIPVSGGTRIRVPCTSSCENSMVWQHRLELPEDLAVDVARDPGDSMGVHRRRRRRSEESGPELLVGSRSLGEAGASRWPVPEFVDLSGREEKC